MSKPPIKKPVVSFEAVYQRMASKARKQKEKAVETAAIADVCIMEFSQVNPYLGFRHGSGKHQKSVLGQRVKHQSTDERTNADLPKRGRL